MIYCFVLPLHSRGGGSTREDVWLTLWGPVAQILVKWWAEYPEQLLARRVVAPLQAYLTSELVITKKLTVSVMNTIKVRAVTVERCHDSGMSSMCWGAGRVVAGQTGWQTRSACFLSCNIQDVLCRCWQRWRRRTSWGGSCLQRPSTMSSSGAHNCD